MNGPGETGRRARCFGAAGWRTLESHPLGTLLTDAEDWDTGMARRGWYLRGRIGRAGVSEDASSSALLVFHRPFRDGLPQFLIEVGASDGETFEDVFVEDADCLTRLLASFALTLESTAVAHLAAAAETRELLDLICV